MNRREKAQQKRDLQRLYQEMIGLSNIIQQLIIITGLTALVVLLVWSRDGIGVVATMMILLLLIVVFLFFLHRSGYPNEAGVILFATVTIIITVLAINGDGIYNIPHIFYPILLIFSGILFGRAMIPAVTTVVILIETLLFVLDRTGLIVPFDGAVLWAPDYFAFVIITLIVTGILLSVTLKTVEENLLQIALSEKVIKESYELTLESWARALELSKREPHGHSQRITELVEEFASDLELDDELKSHLRHGALLHDIGKMGIPETILQKPGPLTAAEQKLSREHTLFAKKMLSDIAYLESLADIPIYHHEQWDGKGYPEGLKEEHIPYTARLFALIDNWVSLTSHQVYRPAWSNEQAFAYIQNEAGKKFDRRITKAFLKFLKKKGQERS